MAQARAVMAMEIIDKIIDENIYNRPQKTSVPRRIAVHYTGDCGATADELAQFYVNVAAGVFKDKPGSWTSTQYVVGMEGKIIRIIPDNEIAYAASGKNYGTIHIEVCYKDSAGKFEEASIAALNELVLYLMDKYKIGASNVVRHYDLTGKHCPAYYVDATRWAALHERITTKPPAKKLYRVQVGAFSARENAENYAKKVRAAGFGAMVVTVGKLYRVQTGAFAIRTNADNFAKSVRKAGFAAFVIEA